MPKTTGQQTYTVEETAEILGIPRYTLYKWIQRGEVAHSRRGLGQKAPISIPNWEVQRMLRQMHQIV